MDVADGLERALRSLDEHTDARAVRRPCASARPITNSTLGPGMAITMRQATANPRT